jgi:hypothetical protein
MFIGRVVKTMSRRIFEFSSFFGECVLSVKGGHEKSPGKQTGGGDYRSATKYSSD